MLVTGHTGFKGSWLGLWLSALGARVTGLGLEPDTAPNLFESLALDRQLDSQIGDIRDPDAVSDVMRRSRPEIVFHLAAQSLVRRSYAEPLATYATNVMGTAHVLDAARRSDELTAIVVVTSDKCYDNREWDWPYREADPLGGHDPYSASKACTELVTAASRASYLAERSVGVGSARAGNVIGGGDWAADRLVPDCVRAFTSRRRVAIRHPGAVRPWQHVLEPLAGYLLLAERLATSPREFAEAWNFGPASDAARTVASVVDRMSELWGDDARWEHDGDDHPHEAVTLQVDASKARARLGWQPRLTVDEGLAWTVDWYRGFASGDDSLGATLAQIERFQEMAPGDRMDRAGAQ